MTLSAVAFRYAGALADLATGPAARVAPEKVTGDLRLFEEALESSADLRNALATPSVATQRKKAVVGRIAEQLGLSAITRNFLFVLIDHRRIPLLREIVEMFETQVDERLGFARARVASARELDQRQKDALKTELESITGKKVRLQFSVDESLIGGVVARIGSTVYDGSLRGQLAALGKRLTAE